jgi:hypothetical protein
MRLGYMNSRNHQVYGLMGHLIGPNALVNLRNHVIITTLSRMHHQFDSLIDMCGMCNVGTRFGCVRSKLTKLTENGGKLDVESCFDILRTHEAGVCMHGSTFLPPLEIHNYLICL